MIRVRVEYAAQLRQALALKDEVFEFETAPRLAEVLARVADRHGKALAKYMPAAADPSSVPASGASWTTFLLARNDEQVFPDHAEPLQNGDTVTLMTPMSGG